MPAYIKSLAEEKERIFKINPFDPRLKTHKLHGKYKGAYSFSIDYKYRVLFDFIDGNSVDFHTIGDHDIYD